MLTRFRRARKHREFIRALYGDGCPTTFYPHAFIREIIGITHGFSAALARAAGVTSFSAIDAGWDEFLKPFFKALAMNAAYAKFVGEASIGPDRALQTLANIVFADPEYMADLDHFNFDELSEMLSRYRAPNNLGAIRQLIERPWYFDGTLSTM